MLLTVTSPSLVHTWSRRAAALSWSCSRKDCCSRCTTAACTVPGLYTVVQTQHKKTLTHACNVTSPSAPFNYPSCDGIKGLRQKDLTHCGAQTVSRPKVEATLLVHGVLKARQLRQSWPIVVKRVIAETVVSAEEAVRESKAETNEFCCRQ